MDKQPQRGTPPVSSTCVLPGAEHPRVPAARHRTAPPVSREPAGAWAGEALEGQRDVYKTKDSVLRKC